MKRAALQALRSHWRRHPFQLFTLVFGLALATALWSGVQAINAEARASYDHAADALAGNLPVIRAASGTIPQEAYVALRRTGWPVSPVIDGWIDAGDSRVRLLGIEPLTAPDQIVASGAAIEGDILGFLTPPGRLLAAPATAKRLTNPDLPPVVIDADLAPGVVIADIGIAQTLLGLEGRISRMVLVEAAPTNTDVLSTFSPSLEIRSANAASDLARLTDSFHLNLTAFGFLSFAVGLLIVHGAIGLAFEQRRSMFRTLRALGVPTRDLTLLIMAELLILALVAGAIGIVLGYLVAAALIPDVAATLRGLYGVPVEGALHLRASWWLAGLGIAIAGTALAGVGSVWRTSRLPVLAPARPRAWAMRDDWLNRAQAIGAVGFMLLSVIAGWAGSGLLAGFMMLGTMLLAAALALPLILSGILKAVSKLAQGPETQWFWADTRQQLSGLSLALMALLLALGANIGVGTMVSSFRLTFSGWLDQRMASEIYVAVRDEAEGARLATWIAPRSDALLPIWHIDTEVLDRPAEIFGVADHSTYRDNWLLIDALPNVWTRVNDGTGVLVNEQLSLRESLAPGGTIDLPGGWTPEIVGVYSDYGNPEGQVIIAVDELTKRFPEVERLRYGVRVAPKDAPALQRALIEEFGLSNDQMTDQASIKAISMEVFERTFSVTDALNVLTLAIAGFAILTSLLTLAQMRLPQLAPVWAIGLSRKRLAGLELLRTGALALLTFVLALPLGLGLAWILLNVINVEAFGWRLPMHVFPGDWLRLGALALLAAILAGLWPAIRLTRLAPADLLRVFTNER